MNSKEARIKELEGLLPDLRQVACDAGYYGLAARIDAVLSQQAEPALAQDERETVEVVGYTYAYESGAYSQYPGEDWLPLMTVTQHERIVGALTRPAQKVDYINTSEQQPFGYVIAKCDPSRDGYTCTVNPVREGKYQRPVYAAPIAQKVNNVDTPEQQPIGFRDPSSAWDTISAENKARHMASDESWQRASVASFTEALFAAPQPEQSNEA